MQKQKNPPEYRLVKRRVVMKLKTFVPMAIIFSVLFVFPSFSNAQPTPLAPNNLVADVKDGNVSLAWTAPVDTSVAGFNVYRKDDLAATDYVKINKGILTSQDFKDNDVLKGKSYTYICKSVNIDGIESAPSNIAGAPKMSMKTSATVTHMGKQVRIATPGDVIKYNIDFANNGYGVARNVEIIYAIPKGTTFISGTARCPKYSVKISYFDEKAGKWVDKISKEENVSRIRFTVLQDVFPVAKDLNDSASLKVMVNY